MSSPRLTAAINCPSCARSSILRPPAAEPDRTPVRRVAAAWRADDGRGVRLLRDHALRWAALRPSWFMQNFTGQHLPSIIGEGRLYSATGDGRVPFIDTSYIAAVAAALVTPEHVSGYQVLTGPEALTYGAAASAVAGVVGQPVRQGRLSVEALAERYRSFGLPEDYADLLTGMDETIADGAEDRLTTTFGDVTGQLPTTLAAFLIGTGKASKPT